MMQRQPYAGVNFIPPVRDFEFIYCMDAAWNLLYSQPVRQSISSFHLKGDSSFCPQRA
jgi:hypothetical protein